MVSAVLLLHSIALVTVTNSAILISPPNAPPGGAHHVTQGFVGFGIEAKSFPAYAGNDSHPNIFSQNLLKTFTNKTGAPVHIRVGGTSMDNTKWDPNLHTAFNVTGNSTKFRLHTNLTLGPPWVDSFKQFTNANYTFQIPLARQNPLSNVAAYTNACIDAIPDGLSRVAAIEIGNEPNLYPRNPPGQTDRPSSYSPSDYAKEWKAMAGALENQIPSLKGQPRFQAGSLSSEAPSQQWTIEKLFDAGINSSHMVETVSQHYYQIESGQGNLQKDLMNHKHTIATIRTKFQSDISFMLKHHRRISYVFGEVGSALSGTTLTDNSLGTALWTADFMLHSMSLGVKGVNMQLGTNFDIASWQPVDTPSKPAQVHGNLYGQVFVADFIGTEGNLQIAPLKEFPSAQHPNIVGYAGYNSNKLSKVAILDLQFWQNKGSSSTRPSQNFTITVGDDVKEVRAERLTSPNGATAFQQNITWAGDRWSKESNGLAQKIRNDTTLRQVNGGKVENVNVKASEAVLLTLLRN